MSNISYYNSKTGIYIFEYKKRLQEKIDEVCNKIRFDDSNVTWYIFDPKEGKIGIETMFIGKDGKDYGYCNIRTGEIYISILSIQRSKPKSVLDKVNIYIKKESDFLANVIIDEITHIQTKRNHGSKVYDAKLKENMVKFYSL